MKSRNLYTIHDVIIRNYTVTATPSGKFLHQFNPLTTDTLYQFETNSSNAELVHIDSSCAIRLRFFGWQRREAGPAFRRHSE